MIHSFLPRVIVPPRELSHPARLTHSPIPIAKKQVGARAWQVLTPKHGKPDTRQSDRVGTHRAVQHFCPRTHRQPFLYHGI